MRAFFLALALLSATILVAQDSQSPTQPYLGQQTVRGCLSLSTKIISLAMQ